MTYLREVNDSVETNGNNMVTIKKDNDNSCRVFADESWICTVEYYKHSQSWNITSTSDRDYSNHVRAMRFKSEDEAAQFYYALVSKCKKIVENHPLPSDAVEYLTNRSSVLQAEEQSILNRLSQIRYEREQLRGIAKRSQINSIVYETNDCDAANVIQQFLDLEITIDDDGESVTVPFVSEVALYNLIGKSDARNVLGYIKQICSLLAPSEAIKHF